MVIYLLGPVTVLLFWRDRNFLGMNGVILQDLHKWYVCKVFKVNIEKSE